MDISLAIFSPEGEQPVKILVVDDDDDNLLLITYQLFQLLDCSVLSAKDGKSALEIAQAAHPDLILLDMMMPEFDGFEVARHLKQDPHSQKIPIVAVTAMARLQDQEMALQAGCDSFLRKPYELEQLAALLSCYLGPHCLSSTEPIG
ncbi:MAG TPA: response regulator [Thermosynechococcaceae cyanobacterium]